MEVTSGWSNEFGRSKFSVTLDETDVARFLTEAGFDPARAAEVPTRLIFKLLEIETERFSSYTAVKAGVLDTSVATGRARELIEKRQAVENEIREALRDSKPAAAAPARRKSGSRATRAADASAGEPGGDGAAAGAGVADGSSAAA